MGLIGEECEGDESGGARCTRDVDEWNDTCCNTTVFDWHACVGRVLNVGRVMQESTLFTSWLRALACNALHAKLCVLQLHIKQVGECWRL